MRLDIIDAAIDESDDGVATRLAELIDHFGEWDWTDDSEHDPCDRVAIVESTGAWWVVYRGTEPDSAERFATRAEANARFADFVG